MKSPKASAAAAVLLCASMLSGCALYTPVASTVQTSRQEVVIVRENPRWAPPAYQGARYYYLPDIECYYDLSSDEFIYLYDGSWRYSRSVPSYYSNFDLDNSFTVVLNVNVYRPWLHHQYYVSHYPRYYYRDYYDHSNIPYVRGFNENRKSAIYWSEQDRHRARTWDDRNLKYDRRFKYQKEDRQKQKETNNWSKKSNEDGDHSRNDDKRPGYSNEKNRATDNDRKRDANGQVNDATRDTGRGNTRDAFDEKKNDQKGVNTTKTDSRTDRSADPGKSTRQATSTTETETDKTQNTNYYGRTIGRPVKVEKQMQQKTEKVKTERTTRTTETQRR